MIIVWTKHYAEGNSVSGYTYNQLISYYIAATLVSLIASKVDSNVTEDIKDGNLSNFVIKPFGYWRFRFAWETAWHIIKFVLFSIPLLLTAHLFNLGFSFTTEPLSVLFALTAITLSYLLSFSLSMFVGTLAFYITETTGITNMFEMLGILLSGSAFPLNFYPERVQPILNWLPFKYIVYFPARVITGQITGSRVVGGLLLQLAWSLFFYILYKMNWIKGIKKFSAVGL